MYNVDKLEEQWIRYRRKKLITPALFTIVTLCLIVVVTFYINNNQKNINENNTMAVLNKDSVSLAMQSNKKNLKEIPKLNSLNTSVPSLQKNTRVGKIIFQDASQEEKKIKRRKNLLIQVTERGGKDIAKDIQNRFEFAKDKSDSLFLAKYYYDKREYSKAEKWALETNKLDNSIEESWIIFAKSQAKQGKRIESLKILKAFLDQTGSQKARALIDNIRRGKHF